MISLAIAREPLWFIPISAIRKNPHPVLIHAKVPLLNHHTSGVRMEWYRDDIEKAKKEDPLPKLEKLLLENISSEFS